MATQVSSESSYLVYAESIIYPKGPLFLLDFEKLWERAQLSKAYPLSFAIIEEYWLNTIDTIEFEIWKCLLARGICSTQVSQEFKAESTHE